MTRLSEERLAEIRNVVFLNAALSRFSAKQLLAHIDHLTAERDAANAALEPWLDFTVDGDTKAVSLAKWLDLYDRIAEEVLAAKFEDRPFDVPRAIGTVRGKGIQDDLRAFDAALAAWREAKEST